MTLIAASRAEGWLVLRLTEQVLDELVEAQQTQPFNYHISMEFPCHQKYPSTKTPPGYPLS